MFKKNKLLIVLDKNLQQSLPKQKKSVLNKIDKNDAVIISDAILKLIKHNK